MRRCLFAILLATLLLPPLAAATGPAEAKPKFQTVRKTFTSDGNILILDNGIATPYPSVIAVERFKKARVTDVNLVLRKLTHQAAADIDILLVAPNGRNAMVMSDAGLAAAAVTLELDDSAAAPLPDNTANVSSGAFRPVSYADGDGTDTFPLLTFTPSNQEALRVFRGIDPNGEWALYLRDDSELQEGSLNRWSLEITAKVKLKKS